MNMIILSFIFPVTFNVAVTAARHMRPFASYTLATIESSADHRHDDLGYSLTVISLSKHCVR